MNKLKTVFLFYIMVSVFVALYKLVQPDYERARLFATSPYMYDCSRAASGIIASAFNNSSSNWFQSMAILFAPVAVVGLPACLIADTVLFPYDYYKYTQVGPHIKFWFRQGMPDIQFRDGLVTNAEQFREHYTPLVAKVLVSRLSKAHFQSNPEKAELLLTLAESSPHIPASRSIISTLGESGHLNKQSMLRICNRVLNNPQNHYNLARHLAYSDNTPEECLQRYFSVETEVRSPVDHKKTIDFKYYAASNPTLNSGFLDMTANAAMESRDIELLAAIAMNPSSSDTTARNIADWLLGNDTEEKDSGVAVFNNLAARSLSKDRLHRIYKKVREENVLINMAKNPSVGKETLVAMIGDYPSRRGLISTISQGDRVDFDIYKALIRHTRVQIRRDVFFALIYNKKLQDDTILYDLLSMEETKNITDSYAYKRLLARTEKPVIKLVDFGILEFVPKKTNLPEEYYKNAGLERPGTWVVKERTNTIPNIRNIKFGILYETILEHSSNEVTIQYVEVYPEGGLTDPDTGKIEKISSSESVVLPNVGYLNYQSFDEPWEMKTGKWVFRLLVNGEVVIDKDFYVVDLPSK